MTESIYAHQPLDSSVHRRLIIGLIERGFCPSSRELAATLSVAVDDASASLQRLDANHGVVLHPGTTEPWVVHPFSTTPTLFLVENARNSWWAPCVWCAFGVATLVGTPCRIHTTIGGESERCVLDYDGLHVTPKGLLAHFPIPIARAWDNVHRHCACTLVFHSQLEIESWCARRAVAKGEVQPVEKVAELGRVWYGQHTSPDWRKVTPTEAADLFRSVGLTGAHWHVPGGNQRF